jgi:hypothetical protein
MEQSMAHHRDPNVPLRLDAATLFEFEHDEEIVGLNARIADLSRRIPGQPSIHKSLAEGRSRLYTQKAKNLRAKRSEYISQWWKECYEGYISGKGFTERDTTNVFEIYGKYIPTRTRLRENLFKEVPIDSEVGRQCLPGMVNLCTSTERVAYYPGLTPVDGQCPVCHKPVERFAPRFALKATGTDRLLALLGNCKIVQRIFYNAGGRH